MNANIRNFTKDSCYWHLFIFVFWSNYYLFDDDFHQISCFVPLFPWKDKQSALSFRILCNQTCLSFLCMSDLDHNFYSYMSDVYSIKSTCNKIYYFANLSSTWPYILLHLFLQFLCGVVVYLMSQWLEGISHTLQYESIPETFVWCIVAIMFDFLLPVFNHVDLFAPLALYFFPVVFAVHLFESYLAICKNDICLNIEWHLLGLWSSNICIVSNLNKWQPQDAVTQD